MRQISASELSTWLSDSQKEQPYLLDVREPWEFDICRIEASHLLPMNQVPESIATLDKEKTIVCICHHGMRSYQVAAFLEHNGFKNILNLAGGVDAWAHEVDSNFPTY